MRKEPQTTDPRLQTTGHGLRTCPGERRAALSRPGGSVVRGRWSVVSSTGTTLLEVLVALAVLGLALGTVALALGAWHGQYRRTVAAWRCREVLGAVRLQASVGQVVCGRPAREIQRGACRARVGATADCRGVRVELRLAGPGVHGTYEVEIPTESLR